MVASGTTTATEITALVFFFTALAARQTPSAASRFTGAITTGLTRHVGFGRRASLAAGCWPAAARRRLGIRTRLIIYCWVVLHRVRDSPPLACAARAGWPCPYYRARCRYGIPMPPAGAGAVAHPRSRLPATLLVPDGGDQARRCRCRWPADTGTWFLLENCLQEKCPKWSTSRPW